jgi:hypothetical protein
MVETGRRGRLGGVAMSKTSSGRMGVRAFIVYGIRTRGARGDEGSVEMEEISGWV